MISASGKGICVVASGFKFPLPVPSTMFHKCLGKDDGGHESDAGSGISSCSGSCPALSDREADSDGAHGEDPCDPEPRSLVFGKKASKTLRAFQGEECPPHQWGILDAVQDLTVEGNNVRMLPHAAFDMAWARSFPGWCYKSATRNRGNCIAVDTFFVTIVLTRGSNPSLTQKIRLVLQLLLGT